MAAGRRLNLAPNQEQDLSAKKNVIICLNL